MAFDQNNFCWLSFANGIQKFDGKNFTAIPVQAGLPDDKWVKFFKCRNGALLFSHSEGISTYNIANNRFQIIYRSDSNDLMPPLFIGEDESAIYFITGKGVIAEMDNRNFKTISQTDTGLPLDVSNGDDVKLSDNLIAHNTSILINATLYLWDLKQKKLLHTSKPIPDIAFSFLRMATDDRVLYYDLKWVPICSNTILKTQM
jgi:hypothetical protein